MGSRLAKLLKREMHPFRIFFANYDRNAFGRNIFVSGFSKVHAIALGKDGVRSLQYIHLDSSTTFETVRNGHLVTLRFSGTRLWDVKIRGRNLWRLFDYVQQHRMSWIIRADRDFAADKEPIIVALDTHQPGEANDPSE
jgi:hypothetical protein